MLSVRDVIMQVFYVTFTLGVRSGTDLRTK